MAWVTPKTFTAGEVVGETDLNTHIRDNLNYLFSPSFAQIVTASAGNLTTTASTAVPISTADLAIALTTYGGNINVVFQSVMEGGRPCFNLLVDNTAYVAQASGLTRWAVAGNPVPIGFNVWVTGLASGIHTFIPTWRGTGETITLHLSGTPAVFWCREG